MPTEAASQAMSILRDERLFQWYVIPLLAFVTYVYAAEVEKRNWSLVLAGLAFWGMDWFNEIWNGLVFHFTNHAPVWGAPGRTAFLILIGLNIEICFMFAVAGVVFSKFLPADRHLRILGIPNRLFVAATGSAFCVLVEYFLNSANALTWDWPWWGRHAPWLIFLIGYLPFFLVAFWVHDMDGVRRKVRTVGAIYAFDIACLVLFAGVLKWI
ncbi:MAG: hypothetical protein A2Y95_07690 [Deltaproteobacteria bacterium RBG_13_65_10]|nr:MAG: hypothetical protein A2Y95_07690 [Deltaproteobacteria bacterium RBG_13_65_10]